MKQKKWSRKITYKIGVGQSQGCPFSNFKYIKVGGAKMAKKSRYIGYMQGMENIKKREQHSTPTSLLEKLKSLKGQEFLLNVPIGGTDGK